MTHDLADEGGSGRAELESLPRRSDALRCPHTEADRRCVLPPGHELDHVYPPQNAGPMTEDGPLAPVPSPVSQ
ncbi:hypothetical protein [Streptosporangium sp. NPDC000396]|uniref:hypothetical protein n=1 Tax=Streptosporangium sp. NPDC000396 TaxID=3366185 RepID=UPI003698A981